MMSAFYGKYLTLFQSGNDFSIVPDVTRLATLFRLLRSVKTINFGKTISF
jgi:hypothetical protein